MGKGKTNRRGFTLVELLIVLAIIGVLCGATGTGDTVTVALNTPSYDINDMQDIFAECGNTVSHMIVRYGEDEATFDLDWYDEFQEMAVFKVTYQFWIPDDDQDGRPDALSGKVTVQSIDFNNLIPLIDLTNPPLIDQASWVFNNGEPTPQVLTVLAFVPDIYPAWEIDVDGLPMGKAPSLFPVKANGKPMLADLRSDWGVGLSLMPGQTGPEIALIANLAKEWGIPVTKAVIKKIWDSLHQQPVKMDPNDGNQSNGEGKDTKTVGGTDYVLTVTGKAWQVPLVAALGGRVLLKVNSSASLNIEEIKGDSGSFYRTPFVAVGDRFPDIRGKDGPWLPTVVDGLVVTKPKAEWNKGPTGGIKFEKFNQLFAMTRLGYIYGAGNFLSTPKANGSQAIFGPCGVTTGIDYLDAKPLFFSADMQFKVGMNKTIQPKQQLEMEGRGYQVIGPVGGPLFAHFEAMPAGQSNDFLSKRLTINWK